MNNINQVNLNDKKYGTHVVLIRHMTGEFVLGLLSLILACKVIAHTLLPDAGIYRYTNVDISKGNVSGLMLILWMFGNTQLGLLLYELSSLFSGSYDRIRFAISTRMKLSFAQLVAVYFLWDYVKLYPLPEELRKYKPGNYLWHLEFLLSFSYLVLSSTTNFFYEKIENLTNNDEERNKIITQKHCIKENITNTINLTDKFILVALFVILALRMATHAILPDGSSQSIARFDLSKGNAEYIVYFFWVYGLTQIGLLFHNAYAFMTGNSKLIRESIYIQTFLSFNHLLMINVLWPFTKSYPFPLDKSNNRPGAWLWYTELLISGGYLLITYLLTNINNKVKKN